MTTFHIVTLFPEYFTSPLAAGLLKRAAEKGIINFTFHNPRNFGLGVHKQVDDKPFGGGPGMLMRLEPIAEAIRTIPRPGLMVLPCPGGRQFNQNMAERFASEKNLSIICGRYEGIDERLAQIFPLHEISLCPAILNGGETAALAIIEAVARLLPGFMGKDESALAESFSGGLLEYPQYTRPAEYAGHAVPEVLLSGNHAEITAWRRKKALQRTLAAAPALLTETGLNKRDAEWLSEIPRERIGRNLSFCLCHAPVWIEKGKSGCSSLTNLDIHDIGRISHSYGLGPFFILHPMDDQLHILKRIVEHWQMRESGHEDRKRALKLVQAARNFEEINNFCASHYGREPLWLTSSAAWPDKGESCVSIHEVRKLCSENPVIICLGTARGLDTRKLPVEFQRLVPIRFLDENHLPVRAAAAIIADRILGDFY